MITGLSRKTFKKGEKCEGNDGVVKIKVAEVVPKLTEFWNNLSSFKN
jgi:hypothetical protein